jgi:putative two-component system response regulator
VVDYFDALTMDRPYRAAVEQDVVLGMMRDASGSHFDPDVLGAFFERLPDIRSIREEYLARS